MSSSRETLNSRIGFILLSVGCAVGLGNVWRFPYVAGKYGGGLFVLLYLLFLLGVGFPLLTMELAVGRAGKATLAEALPKLSGNKKFWAIPANLAFCGNILLMMYYTVVAGWLLFFSAQYITGNPAVCSADGIDAQISFNDLLQSWSTNTTYMLAIVVMATLMCGSGLQKGVEKSVKVMMTMLFVLIIIMAAYALTLPGTAAGLSFYLKPDFNKFSADIGETMFAAMGQAFFTLSLGAGSMTVIGSYSNKERRLTGECMTIIILDTLIALLAGLIIFPICFSFDVAPNSGPGLIFVSMPNVFKTLPGARWLGGTFFIFLTLAALTTVVAVFENLISYMIDKWHLKRFTASLLTGSGMALLSLPCIFGFNLWRDFQPLGSGSTILDLEDFIVSQNLLPLGALTITLFCSHKFGWNWQNFIAEVNTGKGLKFPYAAKFYCKWLLPLLIILIFVIGYLQFLD